MAVQSQFLKHNKYLKDPAKLLLKEREDKRKEREDGRREGRRSPTPIKQPSKCACTNLLLLTCLEVLGMYHKDVLGVKAEKVQCC